MKWNTAPLAPACTWGLNEWKAVRREFESLLRRRVDPVEAGAVRNPFVPRQMDQEREPLCAA